MIEAARSVLNRYIPDIYLYSDVYKGEDSGKYVGRVSSPRRVVLTKCLDHRAMRLAYWQSLLQAQCIPRKQFHSQE